MNIENSFSIAKGRAIAVVFFIKDFYAPLLSRLNFFLAEHPYDRTIIYLGAGFKKKGALWLGRQCSLGHRLEISMPEKCAEALLSFLNNFFADHPGWKKLSRPEKGAL